MRRKVRIRNGHGVFTAWVDTIDVAGARGPGGFLAGPAFEPAQARKVVDWINGIARFHADHGYEPICLAMWDGDDAVVLIEDYETPTEVVTWIYPDDQGLFVIGDDQWGWKYHDDLVD